jgi:hypothetical protein
MADPKPGGWTSLFRGFATGARSFPVCGKGRGSGPLFGPVLVSSFLPVLDFSLLLTPDQPSPFHRHFPHKTNTNPTAHPAANSPVHASPNSRTCIPTFAFSSSPAVPFPILQATLTITARPAPQEQQNSSPETPPSPPHAAGPRATKGPANQGASVEKIGTLRTRINPVSRRRPELRPLLDASAASNHRKTPRAKIRRIATPRFCSD